MELEKLIGNVSEKTLTEYFKGRTEFSSFKSIQEEFNHIIDKESKFNNLLKLGEAELNNEHQEELLIFSCRYDGQLSERSSKKKQYEIAKKVLKEDFKDGAIFVFYDKLGNFRFSFIRQKYDEKIEKFSTWKRYTYFVEPDRQNKTFKNRIKVCSFNSLDEIQNAFSVEKLTKDFYEELSNWYFASIHEVEFPNDKNEDELKLKTNSMIRLITRLMFVWFMKQKNLISNDLFDKDKIDDVLNFSDENETNYYRAILQNLFFATLNTPKDRIGRKFIKSYKGKSNQQGVQNYYRYEDLFKNRDLFLEHVKDIPFLNGGLFENLDERDKDEKSIKYLVDCFSNPKKNRKKLIIPDYLFFGSRKADISDFFEDDKKKNIEVNGIIDILNRYDFTIDENTVDDMEVALDPELLGTVFENLLASYNPETKNTARKESGSFYTPRPIVDFMVKGSIHQHLALKTGDTNDNIEKKLLQDEVVIKEKEKSGLVTALASIKILDPACGSGAFPMGCLQYLVKLLNKLDPENKLWKEIQLNKIKKELSNTIDQSDYDTLKKNIESIFENQLNDPDYARKIYLIENCLFGVDIQPIAMQITKLRFFVSLLVEQEIDKAKDNLGIIALPNLETKFVAANTLIDLPGKIKKGLSYTIKNPKIEELEIKLEKVREEHFNARTPKTKKKKRVLDNQIRQKIAELLISDGIPNETVEAILSWNPYQTNSFSKWFDSEWMFGVKNGFDVVIGNPPYVSVKAISKEFKRYFSKKFLSGRGRLNLYTLFVEQGFNMLKNRGVLAYIIPDNLYSNKEYRFTRELIIENTVIHNICLFNERVFKASVDTAVLLFSKNSKLNNTINVTLGINNNHTKLKQKQIKKYPYYIMPVKARKDKLDLVNKILFRPKRFKLKDFIEIQQGIIYSGQLKKEVFSNKKIDKTYKKCLDGRDILKYKINWNEKLDNKYIRYTKNLHRPRNERLFLSDKKILMPRKATDLYGCIDYEQFYALNTAYILLKKKKVSDELEIFLSFINSKLYNFIYKQLYFGWQITIPALQHLPVELGNRKICNSITRIVKKRLNSESNKIDLEFKIDVLIFKLYELTYEEVLIVDPAFSLSKEEYENYKIEG